MCSYHAIGFGHWVQQEQLEAIAGGVSAKMARLGYERRLHARDTRRICATEVGQMIGYRPL